MAISYQLRNDFTAVDNTALTSYTPDTGPAWAATAGTFKTSSNKLVPNSNANGDGATQEAGQADHTVFADLVVRHDGTNTNLSAPGLYVRYVDATHNVFAQLASDSITLFEDPGTGLVVRSTVPLGVASGLPVRVTVSVFGVNARVWINNILIIDVANVTGTTGTKVGVRLGKLGTPPADASWDTLTVPKSNTSWGTLGTGEKFTLLVPYGLANGTAAKTVMCWHGAGTIDDIWVGGTQLQEVTAGLVGAGYRVFASEQGGAETWGNQSALDATWNLFNTLIGLGINSSGVYMLGGSMGGVGSQNAVGDSRWTGAGKAIEKVYNVYPVCSLADMQLGGYASSIAAAYPGGTTGYDPLLAAASLWDGKAWRATASYSDTVVNRTNNSDAMSSHIAGHATERIVVTHSGDHGDPSAVLPQDVLDFYAGLTGTITGTLAKTQAGDALSAAGNLLIAGALSRTQAAQTLSATGVGLGNGSASLTQAGQTLSAAGALTLTGALGITQAAQTVAAAGNLLIAGSLAKPQAGQTLSAFGSGGNTRVGSASLAQSAQTVAAAGVLGASPGTVLEASNCLIGQLVLTRYLIGSMPHARQCEGDAVAISAIRQNLVEPKLTRPRWTVTIPYQQLTSTGLNGYSDFVLGFGRTLGAAIWDTFGGLVDQGNPSLQQDAVLEFNWDTQDPAWFEESDIGYTDDYRYSIFIRDTDNRRLLVAQGILYALPVVNV